MSPHLEAFFQKQDINPIILVLAKRILCDNELLDYDAIPSELIDERYFTVDEDGTLRCTPAMIQLIKSAVHHA